MMALKKLDKAGQESTVHALAEQRALFLARDCPFIVTLVSCFQTKVWNCLLYTSPSPRDISGSRMPSSA